MLLCYAPAVSTHAYPQRSALKTTAVPVCADRRILLHPAVLCASTSRTSASCRPSSMKQLLAVYKLFGASRIHIDPPPTRYRVAGPARNEVHSLTWYSTPPPLSKPRNRSSRNHLGKQAPSCFRLEYSSTSHTPSTCLNSQSIQVQYHIQCCTSVVTKGDHIIAIDEYMHPQYLPGTHGSTSAPAVLRISRTAGFRYCRPLPRLNWKLRG